MKRIAFFVEGLSEQLFLEKLLLEVFSCNKIAVESRKMRGGTRVPVTITQITTPTPTVNTEYYILIYDCGGDSNVGSYIRDQRESLKNHGYIKIIGIRDVYPAFTRSEIPRLIRSIHFGIPQKDLPVKFILSIMEIESWFLAEETHYAKINASLSVSLIQSNLGFNPASYDTQLFDMPAIKLNEVYQLVSMRYSKESASISRTINALDFANIYFEVHKRISSLKELIDEINLMLE